MRAALTLRRWCGFVTPPAFNSACSGTMSLVAATPTATYDGQRCPMRVYASQTSTLRPAGSSRSPFITTLLRAMRVVDEKEWSMSSVATPMSRTNAADCDAVV